MSRIYFSSIAANVWFLLTLPLKYSEDCVLTGQNTSTSSEQCMGNDRVQPVAEFGDNIVKISVSPVSYCEKMLFQPEFLLYALIKISSNNDDFNFAKGSPEKFVYISRAVYNVYGINFTGNDLRNYFYRSINNLTKGLGKYQGRLRWKFYSKNIQSVITAHRSALTDLLVLKPVSDQSVRDLRDCFELECLSVLNESEESSSLAWKVDKDAKLISKKFPNWHVNATLARVHCIYTICRTVLSSQHMKSLCQPMVIISSFWEESEEQLVLHQCQNQFTHARTCIRICKYWRNTLYVLEFL